VVTVVVEVVLAAAAATAAAALDARGRHKTSIGARKRILVAFLLFRFFPFPFGKVRKEMEVFDAELE
jgi:hypothetical protein